jgi:hypothetical protein
MEVILRMVPGKVSKASAAFSVAFAAANWALNSAAVTSLASSPVPMVMFPSPSTSI